MACGMFLWLVECFYGLWSVSICFYGLWNFFYGLWNVSMACGTCLWLVEWFYGMWNEFIPWGTFLWLVERFYGLWNVSTCFYDLRNVSMACGTIICLHANGILLHTPPCLPFVFACTCRYNTVQYVTLLLPTRGPNATPSVQPALAAAPGIGRSYFGAAKCNSAMAH